MFCKRCGNKLTEGEEICSECGAKIDLDIYKGGKFTVTLPQPEAEEKTAEENAADNEAAEEAKAVDEEKEQIESEEIKEPDSEQKAEIEATPEKTEKAPQNAPKPKKPTVTPIDNSKQIKKTKQSYLAIKLIACLCAVLIAGLTAVSAFTDVFKNNSEGIRTVALSGLTDSEKESFLSFFKKLSPIYGENINFKKTGIYDFPKMLEVSSPNGLYASFFGNAEHITDKADPANRFGNSDGSRSYYKVKAAQLKKLASYFGIELVNSANNVSCYFYDGNYYFADKKTTSKPTEVKSVEVKSSRRTESGEYYITCALDGSKDKEIYCLASYDKSKQGDSAWVLNEISNEALFSIDGTRTATAIEGSLDYEMKHEVIVAKTKKGKTYARYVVDYPYFTDTQSQTAQTINALYTEIINSYKEMAKDADKKYRRFTRRGYDKALLPAYTYFVSTVEYNKNGYISLLDETTYYSPEDVAKQMKKEQAEGIENAIHFPTLTYSGYTIKIDTGEFVKKEDVFGTNYSTYQNRLYELYMGYEEGTAPADANNIGALIYSCPWVLTEDGAGFCYQGTVGYNNFIVLPYRDLENSIF